MLKLAKRLFELRKEHAFTQENAAKKLEISLKSYCRYETGEREPVASVLVRMADFYGVTLDYLVGRSEERGL